jgi:hypothetical protein
MKFHPDKTLPTGTEIFVFGSNLAGRHGAGAAKIARERFAAQYGVGKGRTGFTYAIPTKDLFVQTLPLTVITGHIRHFKTYAADNPRLEFFITRIGCGLAGYDDSEIAPMFSDCGDNCSLPEPWRKYL